MNRYRRNYEAILDAEPDSRASRFVRLHEALPKPGETKIPPPPAKFGTDPFLRNFQKVYTRLPAPYKTKPPDMGTKVIEIGVMAKLLDELRSLVQGLKPKPTT
jgi:hypothetical protein